MGEMHTVRVMLCSKGTAVDVTRVDEQGRVRSVIWQRPVAIEEAPFSFVYEETLTMRALKAARLALLSHSNCLITDRPDLPRADDSSWTTDFSKELALIDAAIGLSTGSLYVSGSSGLQTVQTGDLSKCGAVLGRSRSSDESRL